MYNRPQFTKTTIDRNVGKEGEPLETMVERMLANGEKLENTTELIFTERNEGVLPAYNIRADRMDIALDAMTVVEKSETARRASNRKPDNKPDATIGKPESTDGEVTS